MNDSVERGCFYSTKGNIWHASRVPPTCRWMHTISTCVYALLYSDSHLEKHASLVEMQISSINLIYIRYF